MGILGIYVRTSIDKENTSIEQQKKTIENIRYSYQQFLQGKSVKEIVYVKSLSFPVKTVSIENWIKTVEKLHVYKKVYKDKMRRTDTEMATGLIQCPYCELRYYFVIDKNNHYYRHYSKKSCGQRPKSFKVDNTNNLFETFFFYFYLVYDDTKTLIEENQKTMKINILEIKEKIRTLEIENRK